MEIERIWRDDPIFWECRVLHAAQFPGVSDARYCSRNKETFILEKNWLDNQFIFLWDDFTQDYLFASYHLTKPWLNWAKKNYILIVEIEWSLLIRIELSCLSWATYLFGLLLSGTHVWHDGGDDEDLGWGRWGAAVYLQCSLQSAALVTTNTAHTGHMAPRVTPGSFNPKKEWIQPLQCLLYTQRSLCCGLQAGVPH